MTLAASTDQEMQTLSQKAMMGEVRCVRDFLSSLSVLRLRPCLERIGRKAPMDEKKALRLPGRCSLGSWMLGEHGARLIGVFAFSVLLGKKVFELGLEFIEPMEAVHR